MYIWHDALYWMLKHAALTDELYRIEILGEYALPSPVGRMINTFDENRHVLHALFGEDAVLCSYNTKEAVTAFSFRLQPRSQATAISRHSLLHKSNLRVLKEFCLFEIPILFRLAETVCQWMELQGHKAAKGPAMYMAMQQGAISAPPTADSQIGQIVWSAFSEYRIKAIKRYGRSNPSVQDSINSVKIAFKQGKVFINGESCPELIKDLESLKWKGNDIDKKDLLRSHLADELRYMVDTLWPYRGTQANRPREARQRLKGIVS